MQGSQKMNPHKNSHIFHQGKSYTTYVKYAPTFFMEFLSVTFPFMQDKSSTVCTNKENFCVGRKFIHVRCQVQL